MDSERLLKLADFLETVDPDRFYYGNWVGTRRFPWMGDPDMTCGTTACALGWATQIPEFRAAGLELVKLEGNSDKLGAYHGAIMLRGADQTGVWYSAVELSISSAMRFFDLDESEARFLFMPDEKRSGGYERFSSPSSYAGPSEVAEHIRMVVRNARAAA
jgi:hypothetical protein